MRIANRFNKSKRGQFGFDLADIFSYIGYFIAVLVIILILSLPSCLTGIDANKAKEKLDEKAGAVALVSADTQLTSYLRTQMPGKDELAKKLGWLDKNMKFLKTSAVEQGTLKTSQVNLNVGQAKGFLDSHPEVYADRDYSGFISSLHAFYADEKGDAEMAFKVVTAAMFLRGFSDAKKPGGYIYYLSPVSVDFQNRNPGESGKDIDYDLSVGILPREMLPERKPVQSIQPIPLAGSSLAKIRLTYYPERSSWLPQP